MYVLDKPFVVQSKESAGNIKQNEKEFVDFSRQISPKREMGVEGTTRDWRSVTGAGGV